MIRTYRELLSTPLWKFTGGEFIRLMRVAIGLEAENDELEEDFYTGWTPPKGSLKPIAYGLDDLAEILNVNRNFIVRLSRMGLLDNALVSKAGKRNVYNVSEAIKIIEANAPGRRKKQ